MGCAEEDEAERVEGDARRQSTGMDGQLEAALIVGARDEGERQLGASAAGESRAAVDPPPGARVLVDVDFLAGLDLEDNPVRAPEDRLDRSGVGPCLAAIVGVFACP